MQQEVTSIKELQDFAQTFVSDLKPHEKTATVVALHGELGAGKTSFVQAVAREFGIKENVTSPTFVILKRYLLDPKPKALFTNLIHIDAYRLESGKELVALKWEDVVQKAESIIFIEWAERVEEILPTDMWRIEFKFVDENVRAIRIMNYE